MTPAEICHERELLNTKWSPVQESERERETCREWGRERARELHRTQRTHLSSLSLSTELFFLPLLCFLFCFRCTETVALSSFTSPLFLSCLSSPCLPPSLCLLTPPLVAFFFFFFGQQRAIISGHRRHRYGFMAAKDQQDSGREFVRRGFNESEASSAGEKCMQMRCTHQKGPWVGEASCRPSSR